MMKIKVSFYLLLTAMSFSSLAKTVYIDDQQKIVWTRTGPSGEYRVLYKLAPGTKLEVLQENEETGYVQVKDDTGKEYWIESQFLTDRVTANHLLAAAQNQIKKFNREHTQTISNLEKKLRKLAPLEKQNQELQNKLAKLETELEQVRQKSQVYESGFKSEVFFIGAVVVLGGMFLGWLLSKLGGRKRNSGWD